MNIKEINALLASDEHSTVIAELKNGRNTTEPEAEVYIKELSPKGHDVMNPAIRRDKKVKLDPTDLDIDTDEQQNVKVVTNGNGESENYRIEPVARVALAIQKLIVKRAVAFTFGNPVTLNAEPEEGSKESDVLQAVKRVLFDTKSRTINRKVARSIYSSTEAAELWYPVEKATNNYGFASKYKLRVAVFSPLKGDKLYPYFDETGDMLAFSREYVIKDRTGVKHSYFETYTDAEHRLWTLESNQWQLVEGYPKKNQIGKIPIIYGQQPAVEWEDVQGLIDRLEKLLSNFADTNDYHASPKIFTTGTILGWAKKGESGAVIEGEEGATAQYLSWAQAPESVKLEIDTLLRMIYTITQTPDIAFDSVKGIGAISGVALKLLFMDAHLKVQDKMEIFDDYLQRRLAIIQAFLAQMNAKDKAFTDACGSLSIEPEIVPFMIEDEAANVNLLLSATGNNKAICSRKTAVQQLGWVNDTEAEIEQIEAEENAASYTDIMEPTV
ncbi:MAG: phage portal protein [Clostridia bacterium]|nr:phage portal protein [Clostridia bacterium]